MCGLTEARIKRGMTQLQLSLASGVPQQTISAIESGERRNPGVRTIRKLADAMNCSIDELYPAECDDDRTGG